MRGFSKLKYIYELTILATLEGKGLTSLGFVNRGH